MDRMTPACSHRHYRTARYARRQAFSLEPDRSRRPTPVPCECGTGAWRLASRDAAPDPGGLSAAGPNTDQPGG